MTNLTTQTCATNAWVHTNRYAYGVWYIHATYTYTMQ